MGGDRTCPNDCPLSVWANLSEPDRKTQRKPIAEKLYQQGFTQEAIATQLGVSQRQISTDLQGLEVTSKPPRPKGGRPKGSVKKTGSTVSGRRRIEGLTPDVERDIASAVLDEGKTLEAAVAEAGAGSVQQAKIAVAYERGRRELPPIEWSSIPATAQEKIQAEVNRHRRKLDLEFRQHVLDEVKRRIDEIVLPNWKKTIDQAQELYKHRRGAMDKATFNKIRRALHPDSRASISDKVLAEAFDTFMSLEKFLLDEKDSPTQIGDLPRSWDEWEKAKAAATAARKAKRAGGSVARR